MVCASEDVGPGLKDPTSVGEENEVLLTRVRKPLPNGLRLSPRGKVQRGQYLLTMRGSAQRGQYLITLRGSPGGKSKPRRKVQKGQYLLTLWGRPGSSPRRENPKRTISTNLIS